MLIGAAEGLSNSKAPKEIQSKYYLNTSASLIHRSISEMVEFVSCYGGRPETVYGLAGNAYSDQSAKKIFKLKKRPLNNPLIVHYYSINDLKKDCNIFLEEGEFSQDSPNQIKAKEKRKIQDDAEKAIKDDPKVKKIIEEFGAKVIESTVEPRKSEWVK